MRSKKLITARQFKAATGVAPEQDDLERCNCAMAGRIGHWMCGWDKERNLPNFWPKQVGTSVNLGREQS